MQVAQASRDGVAGAATKVPARVAAGATDSVLERARAGDAAAFETLLMRYRARLLNLAFQLLRDYDAAEDAAQDAFVRAFEGLSSFRGEADLGTWLYRVTLNECLARKRRDERRARVAPPASSEELDSAHSRAPSTSDDALARVALERALDQMSEPLRVVLLLRELHGLSYDEMSRVLQLPESTVRARLHSARAKFRQIWNCE